MRKIKLCHGSSGCPSVEIGSIEVRIGENDNMCVLKKKEWNLLVKKIKAGELY